MVLVAGVIPTIALVMRIIATAAPGGRCFSIKYMVFHSFQWNMCQVVIGLIEVARKQPTLSVLYKLAEALVLPLGGFMGRV